MSVSVCLRLSDPQGADLAELLEVLTKVDARQYAEGALQSPMRLRWKPDELVTCDGAVCTVATVATLEDAVLLERRGAGSCGPLAAAYAGWLRAKNIDASAHVGVARTGESTWHVVCLSSLGTIDPQERGTK